MQKAAKTPRKAPQNPHWRPDQPYNDLPGLPPRIELETPAVLKQCIPARVALEGLKQAAARLPNEAVLIHTLPLLEAQSSSEIENVVTTTDKLFRHQSIDDHADPATKEALRYSHALLEGFRSLAHQPLTTRTAEQVCTKIKNVDMQVRKGAGTALARHDGEIVYTPPEGESRLRDLLANWERFIHERGDLDPLVRMAVGHYQFEAIHPFTDGNGRTGRVLNSLLLINAGLLNTPILYLSRYIIQNLDDYYRLLLEVTASAVWEDWILYMIRGVEQTALWTAAKIAAIDRLFQHTAHYVRDQAGGIYSHELVSLIFELPYCRIQNVVDRGIAKRQTASRYLSKLAELGVLQEQSAGREKVFVHAKYLAMLTQDTDAFSEYS